MTCFSSLIRPDFMSLTAVSLGFMTVNFPEMTGRRIFRLVVAFLMVTFVYDLLWLLIIRSSGAEDAEHAGRGQIIRWFSVINCWLSFLFRIVVIGVFWKVSLNYTRILKGSSHYDMMNNDDAYFERIV